MKKALVLLLVALLCMGAVFAQDNAYKVSAVPYALQVSTSSASGNDAVFSQYGFGVEGVYQRTLGRGVFVEAGLGYDGFFMPDDRPIFGNLLMFAGAGYSIEANEKWAFNFHLDAGVDFLFYKGKMSDTVTVKTGLGAQYHINESLNFHYGIEGTFGFSEKDETKYVNYRMYPILGISYEF